MKKAKIILLSIISILVISINTISFADVGSFDRYDSGSSSSDWGSSSWDSDWDSDYSSSYSSCGDSDIGLLAGLLLGNSSSKVALAIVIIIFVLRVVINKKMKETGRYISHDIYQQKPSSYETNNPVVDVSQSHIYAEQLKQIDPNFSEEKMLSFAKDLYVKLQNAWTARDWEPMRPFETESLFEQHKAQIQGYIDTNRINVVDRIAVNYATLYKFRQEGDRDILEVALKATKKDYIIDATTKELLEGDKLQDRITVYKMTFERKTGVLTQEGTEEIKTTNCPNCGAPTQITSAGRCNYCGSVITTGANTWVLSGLEPLRN